MGEKSCFLTNICCGGDTASTPRSEPLREFNQLENIEDPEILSLESVQRLEELNEPVPSTSQDYDEPKEEEIVQDNRPSRSRIRQITEPCTPMLLKREKMKSASEVRAVRPVDLHSGNTHRKESSPSERPVNRIPLYQQIQQRKREEMYRAPVAPRVTRLPKLSPDLQDALNKLRDMSSSDSAGNDESEEDLPSPSNMPILPPINLSFPGDPKPNNVANSGGILGMFNETKFGWLNRYSPDADSELSSLDGVDEDKAASAEVKKPVIAKETSDSLPRKVSRLCINPYVTAEKTSQTDRSLLELKEAATCTTPRKVEKCKEKDNKAKKMIAVQKQVARKESRSSSTCAVIKISVETTKKPSNHAGDDSGEASDGSDTTRPLSPGEIRPVKRSKKSSTTKRSKEITIKLEKTADLSKGDESVSEVSGTSSESTVVKQKSVKKSTKVGTTKRSKELTLKEEKTDDLPKTDENIPEQPRKTRSLKRSKEVVVKLEKSDLSRSDESASEVSGTSSDSTVGEKKSVKKSTKVGTIKKSKELTFKETKTDDLSKTDENIPEQSKKTSTTKRSKEVRIKQKKTDDLSKSDESASEVSETSSDSAVGEKKSVKKSSKDGTIRKSKELTFKEKKTDDLSKTDENVPEESKKSSTTKKSKEVRIKQKKTDDLSKSDESASEVSETSSDSAVGEKKSVKKSSKDGTIRKSKELTFKEKKTDDLSKTDENVPEESKKSSTTKKSKEVRIKQKKTDDLSKSDESASEVSETSSDSAVGEKKSVKKSMKDATTKKSKKLTFKEKTDDLPKTDENVPAEQPKKSSTTKRSKEVTIKLQKTDNLSKSDESASEESTKVGTIKKSKELTSKEKKTDDLPKNDDKIPELSSISSVSGVGEKKSAKKSTRTDTNKKPTVITVKEAKPDSLPRAERNIPKLSGTSPDTTAGKGTSPDTTAGKENDSSTGEKKSRKMPKIISFKKTKDAKKETKGSASSIGKHDFKDSYASDSSSDNMGIYEPHTEAVKRQIRKLIKKKKENIIPNIDFVKITSRSSDSSARKKKMAEEPSSSSDHRTTDVQIEANYHGCSAVEDIQDSSESDSSNNEEKMEAHRAAVRQKIQDMIQKKKENQQTLIKMIQASPVSVQLPAKKSDETSQSSKCSDSEKKPTENSRTIEPISRVRKRDGHNAYEEDFYDVSRDSSKFSARDARTEEKSDVTKAAEEMKGKSLRNIDQDDFHDMSTISFESEEVEKPSESVSCQMDVPVSDVRYPTSDTKSSMSSKQTSKEKHNEQKDFFRTGSKEIKPKLTKVTSMELKKKENQVQMPQKSHSQNVENEAHLSPPSHKDTNKEQKPAERTKKKSVSFKHQEPDMWNYTPDTSLSKESSKGESLEDSKKEDEAAAFKGKVARPDEPNPDDQSTDCESDWSMDSPKPPNPVCSWDSGGYAAATMSQESGKTVEPQPLVKDTFGGQLLPKKTADPNPVTSEGNAALPHGHLGSMLSPKKATADSVSAPRALSQGIFGGPLPPKKTFASLNPITSEGNAMSLVGSFPAEKVTRNTNESSRPLSQGLFGGPLPPKKTLTALNPAYLEKHVMKNTGDSLPPTSTLASPAHKPLSLGLFGGPLPPKKTLSSLNPIKTDGDAALSCGLMGGILPPKKTLADLKCVSGKDGTPMSRGPLPSKNILAVNPLPRKLSALPQVQEPKVAAPSDLSKVTKKSKKRSKSRSKSKWAVPTERKCQPSDDLRLQESGLYGPYARTSLGPHASEPSVLQERTPHGTCASGFFDPYAREPVSPYESGQLFSEPFGPYMMSPMARNQQNRFAQMAPHESDPFADEEFDPNMTAQMASDITESPGCYADPFAYEARSPFISNPYTGEPFMPHLSDPNVQYTGDPFGPQQSASVLPRIGARKTAVPAYLQPNVQPLPPPSSPLRNNKLGRGKISPAQLMAQERMEVTKDEIIHL